MSSKFSNSGVAQQPLKNSFFQEGATLNASSSSNLPQYSMSNTGAGFAGHGHGQGGFPQQPSLQGQGQGLFPQQPSLQGQGQGLFPQGQGLFPQGQGLFSQGGNFQMQATSEMPALGGSATFNTKNKYGQTNK